jgi:hypothetical protein
MYANARDAKEFLVSRIVDESEREGVPLSEIERKMLYFSETGWSLPDMLEVNAEFDRDYDSGEYEQKIAGLIRNLRAGMRERNTRESEDWEVAVRVLSQEDHYLLVLIGVADGSLKSVYSVRQEPSSKETAKRILILLGVGAGIFLVGAAAVMAYVVLRR